MPFMPNQNGAYGAQPGQFNSTMSPIGNPYYQYGASQAQMTSYQPPVFQQQQPQRNQFDQQNLTGRIVRSPDEILPQEVPMDGRVSLFPMADFSTIYAKTWSKDGLIETGVYVLQNPEGATQNTGPSPEEAFRSDVTNRLDKIEGLIESFRPNRGNKLQKDGE